MDEHENFAQKPTKKIFLLPFDSFSISLLDKRKKHFSTFPRLCFRFTFRSDVHSSIFPLSRLVVFQRFPRKYFPSTCAKLFHIVLKLFVFPVKWAATKLPNNFSISNIAFVISSLTTCFLEHFSSATCGGWGIKMMKIYELLRKQSPNHPEKWNFCRQHQQRLTHTWKWGWSECRTVSSEQHSTWI